MTPWKFRSEYKPDIPLPPAYTFPQAFNYLNPESNSFYILEHENGNYMQCGGSKEACCVERRTYRDDNSYQHCVIGHAIGSDLPATIQMSAGVVKVREREVLRHWEAIELFKCFFAGEALPDKYITRETTEDFRGHEDST
ncbi:hypothetical protein BH09VER1_BH09VER1_55410 [soil metagenome]